MGLGRVSADGNRPALGGSPAAAQAKPAGALARPAALQGADTSAHARMRARDVMRVV